MVQLCNNKKIGNAQNTITIKKYFAEEILRKIDKKINDCMHNYYKN